MTEQAEHHDLADASFRLGDWLVDPRLNRLTRGGESIQIELKMMDVLVCLAERAGELVTRREIIDTVWATEYITEKTLTRAVAELRRTLGDDAKDPRYIETIHRKGYRLIKRAEAVDKPTGTVAAFPVRSEHHEEHWNPYPGLAAFTEADVEFFYGREAEVVRLWRKITTRRLLAIIGPSGVGKSSLLRAGLIPSSPEGWDALIFHPGAAPYRALGRALAPELEGDSEAIAKLVDVGEGDAAFALVARWRQRHGRALLIVDQFEELFTLNPPEVQARFAKLLASVARDADVHILLSMRDDFLYRCHDHEGLHPVFSELTPLKVPGCDDLRGALVQPAARLGYSFEDETLADEMLASVADERGALPMLAFAVARLWEKRDRERKLLTRQAYADIGGVAGALAHHAESTLEQIGANRLPIVREIFRNLVTADGTRAVRRRDDLLSVFSDTHSERPEEVLRQLVDARLLVSYEIREDGETPTRRVEVIHESLLANWPRLVRWQTQDADSAQLRDQLRQATAIWQERGKAEDLLWTGSGYRDLEVWRERYPGKLTAAEQEFVDATSELAGRRRRRRRVIRAAAFVTLVAGLAVVGSFWRQSAREARRAEAANLIALGQLELERNPSGAVAFATASLEQTDSQGARMLAMTALWRGPTVLVVNQQPTFRTDFGPDGSWLFQSPLFPDEENPVRVIRARGQSEVLEHRPVPVQARFFPTQGFFCTFNFSMRAHPNRVVLWSTDDRRQLAEARYEDPVRIVVAGASETRLLVLVKEGQAASVYALGVDGSYDRLGAPDFPPEGRWFSHVAIDRSAGRWLATAFDGKVFVIEIGVAGLSEPQLLGRIEDDEAYVISDPLGRFVATAEKRGRITLWDVGGVAPPTILHGPPGLSGFFFSPDGSLLAAVAKPPARPYSSANAATAVARLEVDEERGQAWIWALDGEEPRLLHRFDGLLRYLDSVGGHAAQDGRDGEVRLRSFAAPDAAEPMLLRRGEVADVWHLDFHPGGEWLASGDQRGLVLWPLARPYSAVIRAHEDAVNSIAFDPQGRWLASGSQDGTLKLWPLDVDGEVKVFGRNLGEVPGGHFRGLAVSPDGTQLLVATDFEGVKTLTVDWPDDFVASGLPGFGTDVIDVAISPDGQLAAGTTLGFTSPAERGVLVWDMKSRQEVKVLGEDQLNIGHRLAFADDKSVLSATGAGLCRWNLATGARDVLYAGEVYRFAASAKNESVILIDTLLGGGPSSAGTAVLLDLTTREVHRLESHGNSVIAVAIGAAGETVVTGSLDGAIRVGRATGAEPHLLMGHEDRVKRLVIDPKGRWIASGGADGTVRLWPMPDLDAPPLHTLPREELIAKLKTLTNLRAVRDPESATGWKIEVGPFPGWETVPSW